MSKAKEIIEKAFNRNKGVIIVFLPFDCKKFRSLAIHLNYKNNSSVFTRKNVLNHHHFGEEKLEAFGTPQNLNICLKDNPKIKVPAHLILIPHKNLNSTHYAFILPNLLNHDTDKIPEIYYRDSLSI